MKTWKDKLTKKELAHLRDVAGITTLSALRETRAAQKRQKRLAIEFPGREPCWDCRLIAKKLGID